MLRIPSIYLTICGAALALCATGGAFANMASPWQPGVMAGEPYGVTAGLAIRGERLSVDMRPLADRGDALIHAAYTVDNPLETAVVTLDFVATQISDTPTVLVDGQAVPSVRQEDAALPESWIPPETAPSFEADAVQLETWKPAGVHRFNATIPPGPHTIDVRYSAVPAHFHGHAVLREHTVAYALAPARAWQSFGGLDVEVLLPPGWEAKSLPALPRAGDALNARFDALPADHLVVTVRPPPVAPPGTLPLWAGLVGGLAIAIFFGTRLARRPRFSALLTLGALATASVAAVALVWLADAALVGDLPAHLKSRRHSYGHGMALLLYSATVFIAAALATAVSFMAARRLKR
jgi:hypothetical protein